MVRHETGGLVERLRAEIALLRAGNETLRRVNAELVRKLERGALPQGASGTLGRSARL